MIITSTGNIEERKVAAYLGLVSGEVIMGANVLKDVFAQITDVVGGRSTAYEKTLSDAKDTAVAELVGKAEQLGADAIVGVQLDYEAIGKNSSMLMVCVFGTAVRLSDA